MFFPCLDSKVLFVYLIKYCFKFVKVLMQTGDTELEMRGRCSAGQKVSGCNLFNITMFTQYICLIIFQSFVLLESFCNT